MNTTRASFSVLAGTLTLFVWYALAQFFPWGTASVSNFSSTSSDTYVATSADLTEAPAGTWTTDAFEDQIAGRLSTLATDRSFSWIFSADRAFYSLPKYFALHAVTQLGVSLLLMVVLRLTASLSRARRTTIVATFAAAGAVSIYGGQMNWMGLDAAYGVGETANLIVGWMLASAVIDRIVLRTP